MTYTRAALSLAAALFLATGSQAADQQLVPRKTLPKRPTESLVMTQEATGNLIVKFVDSVRARPTPEGGLRATQPVDAATLILEQFGMTAKTAFPGVTEDQFVALQTKAARRSGRAQPDLAGMMHITGPEQNLEAAAKALNELDTVEWVKFQVEKYIGGDPALGTPYKYMAAVAAQLRAEREQAKTATAEQTQDLGYKLGGDDGEGGNDPQEAQGPLGCCLPSFICIDLDILDCVQAGGTPQARLCSGTNLCGACCTQTECIDSVTSDVCTLDLMGTYEGDSSDCGAVCLPGACCLVDGTCIDGLSVFECEDTNGGVFQGSATECADVSDECDFDCGQSDQNCWDPFGRTLPFCEDADCCNLVCQFDPFCCDIDEGGFWDPICAATANLNCSPHTRNWVAATQTPMFICNPPGTENNCPMGPDRCATFINDTCFEAHPAGGCNGQTCCNTVCDIEPLCCADTWEQLCAEIARTECSTGGGPGGPTDNYGPLQGYLDDDPYPDPLPVNQQNYVPNIAGSAFFGYTGEGVNFLDQGEPFTDLNGNNWWDTGEPFLDAGRNGVFDIPGDEDEGEGNGRWDPPSGLFGVAENLLREFGIDGTGFGNLTRGRTMKIAVIEWGWWPGHEDLTNVTSERGQTIITIPEIAFNDHGTACLSILNSNDNAMGMLGIVPEAKGYFFPISSVEDGPRELAAWFSALGTLDEGDVISASYGPGEPTGNLNNEEEMWTIFRFASDLGISVCVAAGNGCYNLDNAPDLGDSGAIVVGACSPGLPWYRLAFSNYCTNPPADNSRSNIVHLKAWGSNVASAGYGVLPLPPDSDPRRSYTPLFSGTSAASPQVAGYVAALQGFAKQFYGIPIAPERLRAVMGAPGIPPADPAPYFGGFPEDQGCGLDRDPDLGPNMIGVYTDAVTAAGNITGQNAGGFDDSPRLEDVAIVRGTRIQGNRFSVKGDDQKYLGYDPIYTKPGDPPIGTVGLGGGASGGVDIPEINTIDYIGSGQIADLVFVGKSDIDLVNTLIIENEQQYPNVFNIMVVELFDHRRQEFAFIDFVVDPGQAFSEEIGTGDLTFAHVADSASRFIQRGTNRIVGRIWVLGFPNVSENPSFGIGGDDNFRMQIDLLNIFVSENFGETLPGGG